MQQDEIYLIDLWRIIVREWKWFIAPLLLVVILAVAYTHTAKRQWEATAWIRIGRMGDAPKNQDPQVEPLARVLERLQFRPFQDQVLESLNILPVSPDAALYRKSLKLEPLPYAGPMVKLSVRGDSPQRAAQLAQATVAQLQKIHQRLEAAPLKIAQGRLDEAERDLQHAEAERDRLLQNAVSSGKDSQTALLASVVLTNSDQEIRELQRTRSELTELLSSAYTYETSLAWPVYVPEKQAFPNPPLMWAASMLIGGLLGAFAAVVRNAWRRAGVHAAHA